MKKLLISLLCLLISVSMLFSCNKKETDGDYDTAADFTPEDGEIFADVPNERYDSYTFRVLNAKAGSSASRMDTETVDGDNLNDALYKRNINVEERLDVKIEEVYDTPKIVFDTAVAACLSGEGTYAAVCNTADYMATMAVCGYLVTDEYLTGIDLSKPWWNYSAIDSASVDRAYFFFFGDLQCSYLDAHSMVGVNIDMIDDVDGLPDPYSLVKRGKWTYDAMLEMMKATSADLDGNSIATYDDRYGTATDSSCLIPLMIGCNTRMSTRDEYGLPFMSCFTDEKFYDVFALVSDTLYERCDYVYDTVKNEADGISPAYHFKNGHSLFYITNVGSLAKLRDMDYEFGVLPMPKYNEKQKDYVSFISAKDASAIGVMATGRNLLRTGNIIENLCAESHRKGGLRDCYVDTVLAFKYVNDEKSRENLTTILNAGTFEPAEIYGWGGLCDKLIGIEGKSEVFASTLASVRLKSLSDISDTVGEVNKHRQ